MPHKVPILEYALRGRIPTYPAPLLQSIICPCIFFERLRMHLDGVAHCHKFIYCHQMDLNCIYVRLEHLL